MVDESRELTMPSTMTGVESTSRPMSEVVDEKEEWRKERDTPEWREIHGKVKELSNILTRDQCPKAQREGNPLAIKTYRAARNLTVALAILLEEPNNIVIPDQSEPDIEDGDLGDARVPFLNKIKSVLKTLGYPI